MKFLSSSQLSEHRYKTPEGYLVCLDCILSRTGKQQYQMSDLFTDGDETEVDVDRPFDEVFNEKTLASFENKPFTNEHPSTDVNPNNYNELSVGFVRDIRKGSENGRDVMIGNIVVTDPETIRQIEDGEKTELSCGYDCDIVKDDNGNYKQINIRGNHVALCERGRAGIARIVDSNKVKDGKIIKYKGFTIELLEGYVEPQYAVYDKNGFNMNSHLSSSSDLKTIKQEIDWGYLDDYATKDSVKDGFEQDIVYRGQEYVIVKAKEGNKNKFDLWFKRGGSYSPTTKTVNSIEEGVKYMKNYYGKDAIDDSINDYKVEELGETRFIEYDEKEGKYFIASGDSRYQHGFNSQKEAKEFWLNNKDLIRERVARDSIKDVEPRQGESKENFISRFMSATKSEYPDEKQRLAVAYSYWNKQHDSIHDMALSRTDAMNRCISLGRKFIEHFDKVYKSPKDINVNHWLKEMNNWLMDVKQIKLKENNKNILSGDLRDWFFTAGANPQDFMKNPTYDELEAYDKFTNNLILGQSIQSALSSLKLDSVNDDFYGNIQESKLRQSKDFKLKEYFNELDRLKQLPMSINKENSIHEIKNKIIARVKELKNVPNDIYDSINDNKTGEQYAKSNLNILNSLLNSNQHGEVVKTGSYWFDTAAYAYVEFKKQVDAKIFYEVIKNKVPSPSRAILDALNRQVEIYQSYPSLKYSDIVEKRLRELQSMGINTAGATNNTFDDYVVIYVIPRITQSQANKIEEKYGGTRNAHLAKRNGIYISHSANFKDSVNDEYVVRKSDIHQPHFLQKAKSLGFDVEETNLEYILLGGNDDMYKNLMNDSIKDSAIVNCPDMSLQEMKEYCEMYQCEVYNTGVTGKYRLEGKDVNEVIEELKADGFIEDSFGDSLSSEVRNWWKKVEEANRSKNWGFNIYNDGSDDEDMLMAMFDMISDLKGKDNNLYQEGKRIYNKYSSYSQYKDSIKDGINLTPTSEPGQDRAIYVMQSDADSNLYFYIGKTYAMKDGEWTYAKYKMNGNSPEQVKQELERNGWHQVNKGPAPIIDSKVKDDYSGFLGNYGFDLLKSNGDYEYWYYKDREDINNFNKAVQRIRLEYPHLIVSSGTSTGRPVIYIQKSKYGVKDSIPTNVAQIAKIAKIAKATIDAKKMKDSQLSDILSQICKKYTSNFGINLRGDLLKYEIKLGKEGAKYAKQIANDINSQLGSQLKKIKIDYTPLNDIQCWIDVYPNYFKDSVKDEKVKTPRGEFELVNKTEEELKKEGYSYHHSGNGYKVFIKNNHAVAIKPQDSKVNDAYTYEDFEKDLEKMGIRGHTSSLFKEAKRGKTNLKNVKEISGGWWKEIDVDKVYALASKVDTSDSKPIKDATSNECIEKLKTVSIPEGMQFQYGDMQTTMVQIQNVGKKEVSLNLQTGSSSTKELSNAWGRIWKNGKLIFNEQGAINIVRAHMVEKLRMLQDSKK